MFTRQQYEFIAGEIIASRQYVMGIGGDTRSLDVFVDRIAEAFGRDNPRFDALRFAKRIHEAQR
jgi:hypothetical protein